MLLMINLVHSAIRPVRQVCSAFNSLPPVVKGIAAVALALFAALHAQRALSLLTKWRVKPIEPPPAQQAQQPPPSAPVDLEAARSAAFAELIRRERSATLNSDWREVTAADATPATLCKLASSLRIELGFVCSQCPEKMGKYRLSQLIPVIKKCGSSAGLYMEYQNVVIELINWFIKKEKSFDSETADFLLWLSKHFIECRESIRIAVEEGRVYPQTNVADALILYLKNLRNSQMQAHSLGVEISLCANNSLFREKVLAKAFSDEPFGDSDAEVFQAQLALHCFYQEPRNFGNGEKWDRGLTKVGAPLLAKCPSYVVEVILGTSSTQFFPLLLAALRKIPRDDFLRLLIHLKRPGDSQWLIVSLLWSICFRSRIGEMHPSTPFTPFLCF